MADEKSVQQIFSQFTPSQIKRALRMMEARQVQKAKEPKVTKPDARPVAFRREDWPAPTPIRFAPPDPKDKWYCPACHRFMKNCDMRWHTKPKHPHYHLLLSWPTPVKVKQFNKSHTGVQYKAMIQDLLEALQYSQ